LFVGGAQQRRVIVGDLGEVASELAGNHDPDGDGDRCYRRREQKGADVFHFPDQYGGQYTYRRKRGHHKTAELVPGTRGHA
jgi:hypothetical protein